MNRSEFIIAGNWKMNGSAQSVAALLADLASTDTSGCEVIVFPPALFISQAVAALGSSPIQVGGQNAHGTAAGAHTGEISAVMLADAGCSHALVGHSERRLEGGETDTDTGVKCAAVLAAGMTPILCVGEQLEERREQAAASVIGRQLQAVLDIVEPLAMSKIIIAYEPVWAIGTGVVAKPEEIAEMHDFAHHWLLEHAGAAAVDVKLLYGGSVNQDNAAQILEQQHVSGALVGGASLEIQSFSAIITAARGLGKSQ